jgi:hypothetical protein
LFNNRDGQQYQQNNHDGQQYQQTTMMVSNINKQP